MKKLVSQAKSINNWSKNPQGINTYIKQYKIQKSSPVIDGVDIFDQVGEVLQEYDTTCFNSDLMEKLNRQIKNEMQKKECAIGISFSNKQDVDVWNIQGDFQFTWDPESKMVYNMYVSYFVKSKSRVYFQSNEGLCFILNKCDVELKYNM